jgi:hypothetical protein
LSGQEEDTDIKEEEVADLEHDATANMPPKKKSISPKPSGSAKTKPVHDVTKSMTKMLVAAPVVAIKTPPSICLDFCFPTSQYTVMDEISTKIYV